jgi:DNA-binding NtrC family response regulator
MNPFQIYLITDNEVQTTTLSGLTAVGGKGSSGLSLGSLKSEEDYAVLSPDADGISIHPLKGKLKGPLKLRHLETLALGDLRILAVAQERGAGAKPDASANGDAFAASLAELTATFAEPQDWAKALSNVLDSLSSQFALEKGLLIAKETLLSGSNVNKYAIVARKGLRQEDPWLSESFVEETLKLRQPRYVHNLVGSEFEAKKSLMATGFVSVFAWPLLVRGEVLGVMLMGSSKPHAGLTALQQKQAETFSRLAALLMHFHLRDQQKKEEIAQLRATLIPNDSPFLTNDQALQETCRLAKKISSSDLSVLIQGEKGTGKELLSNWIHQLSSRKEKPFVAVNCGAIPAGLLESLLFGHKKGAFTGAVSDQAGKFQLANGGTLFLDEIGDLPEPLQVKLLRVLQEGQIEPLGSNKTISVDVRIVAASHKSIPDLVRESKFREDLYYRLAEITLKIPALRERPTDITLLAMHFLKIEDPTKRFSRPAWQWLQAQEWRGNVRELASTIRRATILSSGQEIEREDFLRGHSGLVAKVSEVSWLGGQDLDEARDHFVQSKIAEALRRTEGKRKEAAELLGITPRTLFRYLEDERSGRVTDVSRGSDKDVSL